MFRADAVMPDPVAPAGCIAASKRVLLGTAEARQGPSAKSRRGGKRRFQSLLALVGQGRAK